MSAPAMDTFLDSALAAGARERPGAPALCDDERTLTYAALDALVDVAAAALRAAGVGPGDRVGVLLPKSPAAVISILAVLRVRAFVAPLEPLDPAERLSRTVRAGGLGHLVCADPSGVPARLGPVRSRELDVEGLHLLTLADPPVEESLPADGGYILFTSGSTGNPKGVLLTQRNVLHFARWAAEVLRLEPADRVASQASLTFDLSTLDLFSTAIAGACLDLVPPFHTLFPGDLVGWLSERGVSVLYAVPSLYRGLLEQGEIDRNWPPALRRMVFAGEPFPLPLLHRYVQAAGDCELYNLYGPTETNVCTWEQVAPGWKPGDGLSIGVPIADTHVVLLDEDDEPSDAGEIVVAGPTVFVGYLEQGVLRDATRMVRFPDGVLRRGYPTGDLGHRAADGRLHLDGRKDNQVKRNGYRIDLLDVQSALEEQAGTRAVAVVQKSAAPHTGQIWGYVQGEPEVVQQLTSGLSRLLPRRMLPDRVVAVADFPLTDRGKVDRMGLAARPD
ncbi:AMP-binding protein [Micromonospora sp. DT53]|uniref:AMP-binding protein n=1 Tax=Micromonospora sp. DT53 TaxID=3393444 RepID=UPI003CF32257